MSATATPIVTEEKIRMFMMDKPELNTLIDGVRWSPEQIEQSMILTVDYYNTIPPPLGNSYTIENFPFSYLLLMGTCGLLLRGAAINQASNNLTYAADGVQVNDKDKAQIFTQMGSEFWNEYKQMARDAKINQNIANAYGTKFSEYIYRAR